MQARWSTTMTVPIAYVKAKAASEKAADLRESAYATVTKGATDYSRPLTMSMSC
jgi:hypothetical protein